MKFLLALLLLVPMPIFAADESAAKVAINVIQNDYQHPEYKPRDKSHEEAIVATVINSRAMLNKRMAESEVSDEIKICYAISLLQDQLVRLDAVPQNDLITAHRDELIKKRNLLAEALLK